MTVLDDIFYWLLNMSIASTLAGCCILLLRKWKALPRKLVFVLWCIPFLRSWLPLGIASPYSLLTLISSLTTRSVPVWEQENGLAVSMTNYVMAAEAYFPILYKTAAVEQVFRIAALIWVVIAAAFVIAFGALYGITMRELRPAVRLCDNLYVSHNIQSPSTYGLFAPKIVIPDSYAQRDLTFVLMHERVHIRRGDNWWRLLSFVTVLVHWFNPMMWFFLKAFLEDMELSCDETVLDRCGEEQKKAYATELLDCLERRSLFVSAFGGAGIRVRLANILSYKKVSLFSAVCLAVFATAVACVLLTNAAV